MLVVLLRVLRAWIVGCMGMCVRFVQLYWDVVKDIVLLFGVLYIIGTITNMYTYWLYKLA